jgi:predicted metal-binding membrane protein
MTSTSGNSGALDASVLERVLRRDRLILLAALCAVIAIAWIWVVFGAGTGMSPVGMTGRPEMPDMGGMIMEPAVWTPGYAGLMFAMWWVMMMAMMLPSATPMLLLFARINRTKAGGKDGGRPYGPTGIFAAAYVSVWGGFSAAATAVQWLLEQLGFLSAMMVATSYWLGGAILLLAGLWQLTPIKSACLRQCRSPLSFLMQSWRPGGIGAFRMGLAHGAYCLGCCWFLMGLLFFGGIMNLFWIAGLAVVVLLEKLAPQGDWFGLAIGVAAAVLGVLMLANAAGQV